MKNSTPNIDFQALAAQQEALNKEAAPDQDGDGIELLMVYKVDKERIDQLADAEFVAKGVIKGQWMNICARSGAGKSTYARDVCAQMAQKGLRVFYVQCDESGSGLKYYAEHAENHGYELLCPDLIEGAGAADIVRVLKTIADNEVQDLSDVAVVLDTLKKFADLMDKRTIKTFNHILRRLTLKGVTIIGLMHANKYNDENGKPIPEGVSDNKNDADLMMLLVPSDKRADGSILVSAEYVKSRGLPVKEFTFTIYQDRSLVYAEQFVDIASQNQFAKDYENDAAIIEWIAEQVKLLSLTAEGLFKRAQEQNKDIGRTVIRRVLKKWSKLPAGNPYFVEMKAIKGGSSYGNAVRKNEFSEP